MKKYAFFLSLTDNYAYLFNALLNSIELFGMGKFVDVCVIHDESIDQKYTSFIAERTKSMDVDVRFIPIIALPADNNLSKVLKVKYYRYKIMAEEGLKYDSICFIDTDIYLASCVMEFFEIAAKTDIFVGVNDNATRHYKINPKQGQCPMHVDGGRATKPFFERELFDGKFICNTPMFIDMAKYGDVFLDVFDHKNRLGMDNTFPFTGDLETMNLVMNKHRIKDKLLVLASHLWTNVHYSIYRTSLLCSHRAVGDHVSISDPSYRNRILFMSETHDHVRSFHGRDWASEKQENHLKEHNVPKLLGQMEGKYDESSKKRRHQVYDEVQAYFLFLQFHCFIKLNDLDGIIPIRDYDYLKKRDSDLASKIGSFK